MFINFLKHFSTNSFSKMYSQIFLHRLVEITQQIVVFTISRHLTLINLDKDISNCKDSKMRDKHE